MLAKKVVYDKYDFKNQIFRSPKKSKLARIAIFLELKS